VAPTWPGILAQRLARQHLAERAPAGRALDVVADIAGLHAQLMGSAELTLHARVDGLQPDWVARALWEDRTLVKTWAMRGTLHLLPAAELPLWCAAQSQLKPRHETGAWQRASGLTQEQAEAVIAATAEALAGEPLTREQLADAVTGMVGDPRLRDMLRNGFGSLLKPAAFLGLLCFAPDLGRNVRFTRPDRWLGGWQPADPDEAARAVARRYLAAYGPATREQFARWFGDPSPAHAGRWLAALGDEVRTVELDGAEAYVLDDDAERTAPAPGKEIRLLPAFDQYVVAAPRDAEAVLPAGKRDAVYRPQGWLSPVILAGGRIAGTWRHERKGDRLEVTLEPFRAPDKALRKGVEAEVERLAAHLGGTPTLTWTA
jgi:uncharacterized protein YcaQ